MQKIKTIIYFLHFVKKIGSKCGICIIAFIVFLSLVDSHLILIFLFYDIKSAKVNNIENEKNV